jgi:hypothetical protein
VTAFLLEEKGGRELFRKLLVLHKEEVVEPTKIYFELSECQTELVREGKMRNHFILIILHSCPPQIIGRIQRYF